MSQSNRTASQSNRSAPTSPLGRIARKMGDLSLVKTPGSASRRVNISNVSIFGHGRTPNQSSHNSFNQSTAFIIKGRGLARRDLTPSRNRTFNGTIGGGDRYIPNRSLTQFDHASYLFSQSNDDDLNRSLSAPTSPQKVNPEKQQMQQMLRASKSASDIPSEDRIFVYRKDMAPKPPAGHANQGKGSSSLPCSAYKDNVLYSTSAVPTSSVRRTARHIPSQPERILDAPSFLDDYYTNVLDWSSQGMVAVGLGFEVYLWEAESGGIRHLLSMDESSDANLITALRWDQDGKYLAMGTIDGAVRLYDPEKCSTTPSQAKELRKMVAPRVCRTGVLSWRQHVVSAGHRSGQIIHHDVRVAQHQIGLFDGHRQEVCGMKWSPDGKYLASGGGDNIVNIWNANQISAPNPEPECVFNEHTSTVRAIAWCPWKYTMLATGGGMQDMTLKLWDVAGKRMLKDVPAGSQVTDIVFNSDYKEIMTSHGNPNHEIKIWKYPNFSEVANLSGHTGRILSLAHSPCGQYVMSASADESLRIWQCFKVDKSTAKLAQRKAGIAGHSIR